MTQLADEQLKAEARELREQTDGIQWAWGDWALRCEPISGRGIKTGSYDRLKRLLNDLHEEWGDNYPAFGTVQGYRGIADRFPNIFRNMFGSYGVYQAAYLVGWGPDNLANTPPPGRPEGRWSKAKIMAVAGESSNKEDWPEEEEDWPEEEDEYDRCEECERIIGLYELRRGTEEREYHHDRVLCDQCRRDEKRMKRLPRRKPPDEELDWKDAFRILQRGDSALVRFTGLITRHEWSEERADILLSFISELENDIAYLRKWAEQEEDNV